MGVDLKALKGHRSRTVSNRSILCALEHWAWEKRGNGRKVAKSGLHTLGLGVAFLVKGFSQLNECIL